MKKSPGKKEEKKKAGVKKTKEAKFTGHPFEDLVWEVTIINYKMYIDEFNDDRIVPFVERNAEKMKNLDILDV